MEIAQIQLGDSTAAMYTLLQTELYPFSFHLHRNLTTIQGDSISSSIINTQSLTSDNAALFDLSQAFLKLLQLTIIHDSNNSETSLISICGASAVASFTSVSMHSFTSDDQQKVFESSWFRIQSGTLNLISCIISDVQSFTSLISVSPSAAINMQYVNFITISRFSGNGSVLEITLEQDKELVLDSVFLHKCSCTNGNGGGIYVNMNSRSKLSIGNISATSFSSCSVSTDQNQKGKGGAIYLCTTKLANSLSFNHISFSNCTSWKGNNIFVEADYLFAIVNAQTFKFDSLEMNKDDMVGFEGGDSLFLIPLYLFFVDPLPSTAFVASENSKDFSHCGFQEYPCSSLKYAITKRFPIGKISIVAVEGFTWKDTLLMDSQQWDVKCLSNGSCINVVLFDNYQDNGLITSSAKGSLINASFSLTNSLAAAVRTSLFTCNGDVMNLLSCSFTSHSTFSLQISLINVVGGVLKLQSVWLTAIQFSSSPAICISRESSCIIAEGLACNGLSSLHADGIIKVDLFGVASVLNSTINSNTSVSCAFVTVTEGAELNLRNTTFSGLNSTLSNGSCLSIIEETEREKSVDIWNCSFVGCNVLASKSCGGAMFMKFGNCCNTKIESCSFSCCSAPTGSPTLGFGGGLFLELRHSNSLFVVSSPAFSSSCPNNAHFGRDIFVSSPNLTATTTETSMPFLKNASLDSIDSAKGFDGSDVTNAIPLVYFFASIGSTVSIASSGLDVAPCGIVQYPCRSLTYSFNKLKSFKKSIILSEQFILSEFVALDSTHCYNVSGLESCSNITVVGSESDEAGLLCTKGIEPFMTIFNCILFNLPSSIFTSPSLFSHSNPGELVINCCSFNPLQSASSLAYHLFSACFGSHLLNIVQISNIISQNKNILSSSGSVITFSFVTLTSTSTSATNGIICLSSSKDELNLTNCSFSLSLENEDCAVVYFQQSQKIVFQDSNFTSATRNSFHGGVLQCTVKNGKSLIINGGCFNQCSCTAAHGGGLYIEMDYSGYLVIGNASSLQTSFTECCSYELEGKGGFGGGIYLGINDGGTDFYFSNLLFNSCNASKGKNIFLNVKSLKDVTSFTKFDFSFNSSAYDHPDLNQLSGNEKDSSNQVIPLVLFFRVFSPPAYVGPEGSDYSLCGFSDYPCCSILAAIRLFDGINATIQLSQHFVFLDRICLNKTNTTIAVEQIGTQINVQNGGSGEGDGLIETQTDVTFWGITLSAPPLLTERTTLFECSGSTLSFQDFRTAAAPLPEGLKYAYSFVHVKRGTLTCTRFSVSDSSYGPVPLIVAIGNSLDAVKCNFVNISIISTYSQSINGLIYVLDTETLTIENMTSNFCTQELCALVSATDVNLFSVKSSNFKRIERISGFGGVISASVRDGHELTVSNTSFDGCAITQENMKGGSLSVSVEKSGRFAFDSSTVKLSTVCGENSCGGGIYASFSEESVQYSMKRVAFSQNKAEYGKHFYLACPSPRNVVKSALFTSSFSEEMDDADLWVCNSLDILSKGETMKKYLFSSSRETMFVDEGQGVDPSNCGNETHPCTSLDIGFSKMTEIQSVILILFSATAQGTINRRDKSLSIDGKSKSSILLIESDAHFELTNGNRSTSLTFSKLTISLPALFNNKELIKAFVGILSMKAIDIVSSTQEQTQAHLWIISGGRGIIQLDEVSVEGLNFSVNAGICSIDGGSCILEHCNISVCSSDHVGLVAFNNNANASIKQSSFQRCKMNHGSIIRACNCAAVELSDSCMIEDCISLSSDGCAINCLMSESCKLRFDGTSFVRCETNRSQGKGGGMLLHLSNDSLADYQISQVKFSENKAAFGKDLFLLCKCLNSCVTQSHFLFSLFNSDGAPTASMEGTDYSFFNEQYVDLFLFLIRFQSSTIKIAQSGFDAIGCGKQNHPCKSFWAGFRNLDPETQERQLSISTSTFIQESYQLKNIAVVSTYQNVSYILTVYESLGSDTSQAVLHCSDNVLFDVTKFVVPAQFSSNATSLLRSSSRLTLKNCSFECNSTKLLGYSLISSSQGRVELIGCIVQHFSFHFVPFDLNSDVTLEACNFTELYSNESPQGGVFRIQTGANQSFTLNNSECKICSCSVEVGRGGFIFLDSSKSLQSQSFRLLNVIFLNNSAFIGKNMFIESPDLNSIVTSETFSFSYDKSDQDPNLFIGNDQKFTCANLLRFLVKYTSSSIFVSFYGFDIMRCGAPDDPCFSFRKGWSQTNDESLSKSIFIHHSSFLSDSFDLSNYTIQSSQSGEEQSQATLNFLNIFEQSFSSISLTNSHSLSIQNIAFSVGTDFSNNGYALIICVDGNTTLINCSLQSMHTQHSPGDYSFLNVQGGKIVISTLSFSQIFTTCPTFLIFEGCDCTFEKLLASTASIQTESLFTVHQKVESLNSNTLTYLCVSECEFYSAVSFDNNPSLFCCSDQIDSTLTINGSTFESCRALDSLAGGLMLFPIVGSGSMKMQNSSVIMCSCSATEGAGGGLFLSSELVGDLNFLLQAIRFDSNVAKTARDVFVRCFNISRQINESQFVFDLRDGYFNRINAIYGIDKQRNNSIDLIELITIFQASVIHVSQASGKNGINNKKCGFSHLPCQTVGYALGHLVIGDFSTVVIDLVTSIEQEIDLHDVALRSKDRALATISCINLIEQTRSSVIDSYGSVEIHSILLSFSDNFFGEHVNLFKITSGSIHLQNCLFSSNNNQNISFVPCIIFNNFMSCTLENCTYEHLNVKCLIECDKGNLTISRLQLSQVKSHSDLITIIIDNSSITLREILASDVEISDGHLISFTQTDAPEQSISKQTFAISLISSTFIRCNQSQQGSSIVSAQSMAQPISFVNCSFSDICSPLENGSSICVCSCSNIDLELCLFDGYIIRENESNRTNVESGDICFWNGSLLSLRNCSALLKDTTITNSSKGGIDVSSAIVSIHDGKFSNNNPTIDEFPSVHRNIICTDDSLLNIASLKGGDGFLPNTSLWISNNGCTFGGVALERASPFFVPKLHSANTYQQNNNLILNLTGSLLLPCDLQIQLDLTEGSLHKLETFPLHSNEFLNETEIHTTISASLIFSTPQSTEVSVAILFSNPQNPSSTSSIVLKNKTDQGKSDSNDALSQYQSSKSTSLSTIILIVFVVLFLIVFIGFIVFVVRWKKQKRRTEELEVIVEDTVRKDPKLIEMVTMEMSPEEQWRRAEREAEKKNEERIKKRVYEKSLGHSESSEHLLSESGSTEYILGRDSDKIPDWALEKLEEDEDDISRKRTPSPSISSTSTTHTSDTESTFVRGEDLCPTTSSMSNLVDAMVCSSPHEKLIVDLRDSMFMLLHGRNKTKEMPIGSLKEREQTAAQILFWVANLALHSFDEMENPLQSLANLSPHIVLFSEHMVICIALHSDLLSDDSSSSISSSTVVTSASDDDDDSLPSSAFEDEDDYKKECLRWKAPELLINKKMDATKESVAFSIGMMLWECLALQIPFGEYEAEVAGQKIVNGERPNVDTASASSFSSIAKECISRTESNRPSLINLKREFIQRFPNGAAMLTISDAIDFVIVSGNGYCGSHQQASYTVTSEEAMQVSESQE